jgi:hypothetical protein
MDSNKLRPYKLCLASKLNKNLRSKYLRSNHYRQPQAIKHLKFLKLPYLNPCLKLRNKLRKNLRSKIRYYALFYQALYPYRSLQYKRHLETP